MIRRFFPVAETLTEYDRATFRSDLSAGLTVGVMLIPQGMAYALIAGVPPIYGLYASLVPLVVYALMGTSRQLAVGPVAIVSLLVAAGVAPLAAGDPDRYIALTFLLALMVGIIQVALGLLRFGFLTNFLSHPVLAGFTSAAALVIGASQLRHLFGVELPGSNQIFEIGAALVAQWSGVHLPTVLVGVGAIVLLAVFKRWRPRAPGALVVVALATALAWFLGFEGAGIRVVGDVPGGLPAPVLPPLDPGAAIDLLPVALTIALVGFMESIAVAKVYATRHRYAVDPDRELVALGMANVVGSFFRAFPTTGGFSRTAVNDQAGSRTTLSSLVAAGIIGITLAFLTGLFHHLPNGVLAAIVLVAVANLVDWREAVHLWRTDRRDLAMMGVTFLATLLLGIEEGILVGVVASLLALVYQTSRPHVAICGRLPGTDTFRNVERHPEARAIPGVVIFRPDATLSFANAEYLRSRIRALADGPLEPRSFVFDFSAVNGMDSTAAHEWAEIMEDLRIRGIEVRFAGVKGPVMDRFRVTGLDETVGRSHFHLDVGDAVRELDDEALPPEAPDVPGEAATVSSAPGR